MEKTPKWLQRGSNYHEFSLPKANTIVQCHSWHETLFLMLSDGDPSVSEVESQPESIRGANGKFYIPDARIKSGGRNQYVEIKSAAAVEKARPRIEPLLSAFARSRGAIHAFVSHEDLDARQAEAMLAMKVSRWVMQYREDNLDPLCSALLTTCRHASELTFLDLINHHAKWPAHDVTGAVCILIHQGALLVTDPKDGLSHHTRVSICKTWRKSTTAEIQEKDP